MKRAGPELHPLAPGVAMGLVDLPVRIALVAALLGAPCAPAGAQDLEVDLELVLAVDISGSVDEAEARLQREGYIAALRHPHVIQAIQSGPLGRIAVTYVEWAGDHYQRTMLDWTADRGRPAPRRSPTRWPRRRS